MLRNYLTVMVIPQKGGKVFKFELSVVLFKLMVLLVGVLVIASTAVFLDYIFVKERSKKLKNIKKAMMLQSLRVQTINNKLTDTEKKLDDFEDFERKLRLISGTQESGSRIRYLGNSGNLKNGDTFPLDQGDEIIPKLKKLDLDIKLREISFFQLGAYLQEQKDRLAKMPSIAPARGHVSSRFGKRHDPFTGKWKFHQGYDISNREYTPVYAPADGVVVNTMVNGNLGEFLVINHGYNIITRYGHLAKYEVSVGQKVKRGDLIARIGNTGRSTASHLHYEILVHDQYVDPEKYLLD